MKKFFGIVGLVALFGTSNALAFDSATVTVTAEVVGSCLIDAPDHLIALGVLDDALGDGGTVTMNITCNSAVAWTLTPLSPLGARTLDSISTAGSVPYDLSASALTGTDTGSVDFTATVLPGAVGANPVAADYTDQVIIEINP